MADAVGTLRIDLFANIANMAEGLQQAGGELKKFQGKVDDFAKNFISFGGLLEGVVAGFVEKFVEGTIEAAGAAQKFQTNLNLIFGESANDITGWSKDTAAALHRTVEAIEQTVTGFKILFDAATPNAEAANELSKRFASLTVDLAAFQHISESEAQEELAKGLEGSARALKLLGININDATLQNKAFELGIIRQGQTLDDHQKVLVRSKVIMDDLQKIQGYAANNTDSADEATKRLKSSIQEMNVEIGTKLLPFFVSMTQFLDNLIKGFEELGRIGAASIKTVSAVAAQAAQALAPAMKVVGDMAGIGFDDASKGVQNFSHIVGTAADDAKTAGGELTHVLQTSKMSLDDLIRSADVFDRAEFIATHLAEFKEFQKTIDPVTAALAKYDEEIDVATKFGMNAADAQRAFGTELFKTLGGVEDNAAAILKLRPQLAGVVADLQTQTLEESAKKLVDSFGDLSGDIHKDWLDPIQGDIAAFFKKIDTDNNFVFDLNKKFGDDNTLQATLSKYDDLFNQGAISAKVYGRAVQDAIDKADPEAVKQRTKALQEQQQAIAGIADELTNAAAGTESWADAFKNLITEMLKTQIIKPFITNSLNTLFGVKPADGGGGAGGLDFGKAIGGIGSFVSGLFGGGKAEGGTVYPGISYMVGEKGRAEIFTPNQVGTITPGGKSGAHGGTTQIFNIQTPDPGAFKLSQRQIARRGRQSLGVGG